MQATQHVARRLGVVVLGINTNWTFGR
jgi:hypothetical protein